MILRAGGPNIANQAGGNDYFAHLRNAGGTQVGDINALAKGDVVQVGRAGGHTFIIVGRVSGNVFDVVERLEVGGVSLRSPPSALSHRHGLRARQR